MKKNLLQIIAATTLALTMSTSIAQAGDEWTVTLDESIDMEPASGRVILFFATPTNRNWRRMTPINGPFFSKPQPIASIAVENFKPGESVTFTPSETVSFPVPLDELNDVMRVQAIFDHDQTERDHAQGPGNVYSEIKGIEVAAGKDDRVELRLTEVVEPLRLPDNESNLVWVEHRSDMLSDFYGRDVFHRAGVALPPGYIEAEARLNDESVPDADGKTDGVRTHWPTVYVIPGYGGRHTSAKRYAGMLRTPGVEEVGPMAVHVVLDPESPLGHHGFVDGRNHGPRGTAFVEEFIPYLESQFRLVARTEARIVTGHSSGGWSSLWLQLQHPATFGGCWSSAPDPVDFSAFQMSDIYKDENVYIDDAGRPRPSYREVVGFSTGEGRDRILMTVRQEGLMERAVHPLGASGQQWDAWEAMFSPRDDATGLPRPMFDAESGAIDRDVVEHWKQFDIKRMAENDWDRYGRILAERVRLACGTNDSFYLERAVARLKQEVDENMQEQPFDGPGYISLVENATHGNLLNFIFQNVNREMREHLRSHGLHH